MYSTFNPLMILSYCNQENKVCRFISNVELLIRKLNILFCYLCLNSVWSDTEERKRKNKKNMICRIRVDLAISRNSNDVVLMVLRNNKLHSAVNKQNVHYEIKGRLYITNALRRMIERYHYILSFNRKIY